MSSAAALLISGQANVAPVPSVADLRAKRLERTGGQTGDVQVTLSGKGARDRSSHEIALELPALSAGAFVLRYKVLAVDGHVTENLLRFTVAAGD